MRCYIKKIEINPKYAGIHGVKWNRKIRRAYRKAFSLVSYYGGKARLIRKIQKYIIQLAEESRAAMFIECFGGGGRGILNLDQIPYRFLHRMYNEWDESMACLFAVCQHPDTAEALYRHLLTIPYKKETFDTVKQYLKYDKDGLLLDRSLTVFDKAVIGYLSCAMSFNSARDCYRKLPKKNPEHALRLYYSRMKRILEAPQHLAAASIVQGDYKKILEVYGKDPTVLKFLDPPYHPATRSDDAQIVYKNEMTPEQHREMVAMLCESHCWILCGYDPYETESKCEDYKPLEESGAVKVLIGKVLVSAANYSHAKNGEEMLYKNEYLWIKL